MSNFKQYSSIENSYNDKYMSKIDKNAIYVVTEKIHGSNFSVIINSNGIKYATKDGVLESDKYFYNYIYTMKNLEDVYTKVYNYLKSEYNCDTVQIIGEFAGGGYPHPETEHLFDKNYKLVQNEVFYASFNFHYIFDIMIDGEYIDYVKLQKICSDFDLLYSFPLFMGTLDECLALDINVNSNLANILMSDYPIHPNIKEGNVIRPLFETKLPNGDRVIIKHKNEKFSEISKEIDTVLLSKIKGDFMDTHVEELFLEISKYVTINRLNNVLSHLDEKQKSNINLVLGKFASDVVKDFSKDNEKYNQLETKERKYINTKVNALCSELYKNQFNND